MPLTANRELNRFVDQELRSFPVAADVTIFKGALVGIDRATGHVRPLVAKDLFAGIAYEQADNEGGEGGDIHVRVYTHGDFILPVVGAAAPLVGAPVFAAADEQGVLTTAAGGSLCGVLLALAGADLGVVRLIAAGAQMVELALNIPLVSSTAGATTATILVAQRALRLVSAQVSFVTVPNSGALDVGTTLADPDENIDAFNLASLSANTPAAPPLVSLVVPGESALLARVGQATTTAGTGGLLSLRYVELP